MLNTNHQVNGPRTITSPFIIIYDIDATTDEGVVFVKFSLFAVSSAPSSPAGEKGKAGGGGVVAAIFESGNAAPQLAYTPVPCFVPVVLGRKRNRVLFSCARKGT